MICTRCEQDIKGDWVRVTNSVVGAVLDMPLPSREVCFNCLTESERERAIESRLEDMGLITEPPFVRQSLIEKFSRADVTGIPMSRMIIEERR